ncbi:hypothetical protein [Parasphingopyxis lamellibrachiae]|uniref:Deoxycytidine triphosphate deaminase n=1 Tax=Parasphingopyxis lamellibrachiae TaxID=680125 RepID=A0A3D9FIW4_9SPHN|nr:hypothetical protein [Parasphingopyxis lamellibrachiae]RED17720.1 deoxycytidine triphosphate deaminase [Parasphingopyxis lamellibrachiae]
MSKSESERELISRERGKRLANGWRAKPKSLPIPDTLLSSEDIQTVVKATGAISPFYVGGGRESRLKKAAYEGRIGSKAYIYRTHHQPDVIFDAERDDVLKVPSNSIVFVESDIDFRLPDFLALRFNLQIKHVHRGLLLGTGPLVDPGYWGKLCIPLHNLTDQDYEIEKSEGLIWIEFTKTTLPTKEKDKGRVPLGSSSDPDDGHWEIKEFLDRVSVLSSGARIPIRSSISEAMREAALNASEAKRSAEESKSAVGRVSTVVQGSLLAGLVGVFVLTWSYYSDIAAHLEDTLPRIEQVDDRLEDHLEFVEGDSTTPPEREESLAALRRKVEEQELQINEIRSEIRQIRE